LQNVKQKNNPPPKRTQILIIQPDEELVFNGMPRKIFTPSDQNNVLAKFVLYSV